MVFLSVVVGESISRFDIVMALIGGSLTGSLVFILPPLIYTRALALKKQLNHVATTEKQIYSSSRTKFNGEEQHLLDPAAHSRSIYYGYQSATNNPRSYTYLYFDDLDDETNSSDSHEGKREEEVTQIPMIRTRQEDQSLLIDAAEPSRGRIRKHTSDPQEEAAGTVAERRELWNLERTINYFGCFVVTIGIVITLSSTYVNILNTIRYVSFTPPCIINATMS